MPPGPASRTTFRPRVWPRRPRGGVRVFRFLRREGDAVEEKIGVVTDYLDRIGVAVIQLTAGDLHVGDQVHITGRTTEHYAMGRITSDRARGGGGGSTRPRGRDENGGSCSP
jgi:hypothetical protein